LSTPTPPPPHHTSFTERSFTVVISLGLVAASKLSDAIDLVPALRDVLRYIGFVVTSWAFWRWVCVRWGVNFTV
jgi:hypothetical protein